MIVIVFSRRDSWARLAVYQLTSVEDTLCVSLFAVSLIICASQVLARSGSPYSAPSKELLT